MAEARITPSTASAANSPPNWLALQSPDRLPGIFAKMGQLAMQCVFESPVDATYPLEQVREAIEACQVKGRAGKILLRISD